MIDLADFAAGDHRLCFLHERIIAIIKINRVHQSRFGGEFDQLPGFNGGHREWLFGNDMFAGSNNLFADVKVQVIGRAVVDDLDFLVSQEIFDTAVCFRDVEFGGLGFGEILARLA